ncbi:unnamed protein product [Didymodactylos carnosus]|uniref:Uncharacterized protein n=1 Tax=Didymodactylos carnosus TaxID=1234261 RepID=A0A8S2H149_9BILA|nr:unnamed protein product [Didymodactylos carnosus]CAF3579137.1 unnamed protein product [Didymodactylos carnosus]
MSVPVLILLVRRVTIQSHVITALPTSFLNITPLDLQQSSQYQPTTIIQELVYQLMIEQRSKTVSYSSYYDECQPKQCRYRYVRSVDVVYAISTLIALIDDLTKILRILVPNLVKLISRKKSKLSSPSSPNNNDKCVTQAKLYDYLIEGYFISIPSFYFGCYILEAVLQSTLECFYSQQCFTKLNGLLNPDEFNITSQYEPTTKIQTSLDQLMTEKWSLTVSFDQYFKKCQQ